MYVLEALHERRRAGASPRAMTRIVSSPAMVPTASGSRARSIARASGCAWPRAGPDDDELLDAIDAPEELGGRALERAERRLRAGGSAPGRW